MPLNNPPSIVPALQLNNSSMKLSGVQGFYKPINGPSTTQIMGRKSYRTKGAISKIQAVFQPFRVAGGGAGGESNNECTDIISCSVEYLTGHDPIQLTFGGKIYGARRAPSTSVKGIPHSLMTDVAGVQIPAGTQYWIRTYKRVSTPPASAPVVALAAGGSLTVAQPYYYFVTSIDQVEDIESGPTLQITATVTPTSGNQTANISWVAGAYARGYRVYRGTTNDPTVAQLLFETFDRFTLSYSDTGARTPLAIIPPITQILYQTSYCNTADDSVFAGSADTTGNRGVLPTSGPGPTNVGLVQPSFLLTNDVTVASSLGWGDSIEFGTGITPNQIGALSQELGNWYAQGMAAANTMHYTNFSIPSSTIRQFVDPASALNNTNRYDLLNYPDYIVSDLGTNDKGIDNWTVIAANHIKLATPLYRQGKRYIVCTICPVVTSTNNCLTIAGQTPNVNMTNAKNYNLWVRGGMQVDGSGTPVLTGGTPTPYIYGYFDLAATVSVNSSNVPTLNGDYLVVPATATLTGQVLTGTPTLTSLTVSGTPYTASSQLVQGYQTYAIKMTSGAANGQTAIISSNTSNVLTLYANGDTGLTGAAINGLTTIPAAGDTFEIWQNYFADGLHPSIRATVEKMGPAFADYILNNMKPFGTMLVS